MTVTHERPTTNKPAYVGGLDGLRAIAVVAVIIYHFAPSALPAGFLGVDVFFVVSGFLIARLVVAEIVGTGEVKLRHFWARRARRLLPALGTMTVVVLCAVAINSSSAERHDIRAQALGTLFYCANWVMIYAKGSYFTSVGRPSPFLHMWTLAVEEQFYVVLPLVCFAARRSIVRHPVRAAGVALGAAVASTVWMAYSFRRPVIRRARISAATRTRWASSWASRSVCSREPAARGTRWSSRLRVERDLRPRVAAGAAVVALLAIVIVMRVADDHTLSLYPRWFPRVRVVVRSSGGGRRDAARRAGHADAPGPVAGRDRVAFVLPVSVALAGARVRVAEQWLARRGAVHRPPARVGRARRGLLPVGRAPLSCRCGARSRSGSRGAIAYFVSLVVVAAVLVATVAAPVALGPSSLAQAAAHQSAPAGALRVDLFGDSTGLVFGLSGATHSRELDITVGGDARWVAASCRTTTSATGASCPGPRSATAGRLGGGPGSAAIRTRCSRS